MADIHYGPNDGSAITFAPNQPHGTREGDIWSYTWEGWADQAAAPGLIPAEGTTMDAAPTSSSFPQAADCALTRAEIRQSDSPSIVEITLTYTNADSAQQPPKESGDVEQRAETIAVDFSVDDAAAYDAYPDEVDAAKNADKKTISIGGLRYQYSTYANAFTWSEANLVEESGIGIGQVGAPTGITSPTAKKWIFRGSEVTERGGLIQQSETWEYSPMDWPAA